MTTKLPKSRHGDERIITNNGGGCYTVEGPSLFHRCITDNDNKTIGFDFEGGPCLVVGDHLQEIANSPIIEELIPECSTKKNWAKVTVIVKDHGENDFEER